MSRLRSEWLFVTALLLFAAGLRFAGLSFGQPDPQFARSSVPYQLLPMEAPIHPDEFLFITLPLQMLVENRLNPKFYHNPSLLIYANYVTFAITGADNGIDPAVRRGLNGRQYAPFHLYVIGRAYSALGGLLAVGATYALARRVGGRFAALVAGLVAAASLPLVQHAHYTTTSSLAAGFTAVSAWAAFAWLRRGQRWPLLALAAVCAGLAAGSRYNAAAVALVVGLVGLVGLYRWHARRVLAGVLAAWALAPLTFALTTPAVILDTEFFLEEFRYITGQYLAGIDVQFPVMPWVGLLLEYRYLALFGLGVPAALLVPLGVYATWAQRPRLRDLLQRDSALLCTLILLVYLAAYSYVNLRVVRPNLSDQMLVPVLPQFALLAGLGAAWLCRRLPSRPLTRPALALAVVVVPLTLTLPFVRQLTQLDTREIMLAWIYDHVPRGAIFHLNGPYNVPLDPADYPWTQTYGSQLVALDDLRAAGVDYMIVSDAWYHDTLRATPMTPPDYARDLQAYLDSIDSAFPRIAWIARPVWAGYDWMTHTPSYWHNPSLTLYCLNAAACGAISGGQAS
ncbi:MAG: hypothetical protein ACUVSX_03045 [Aggregatilineales bacterium]